MNIIALAGKKQSGKDTVFSTARDICAERSLRVSSMESLQRVGRVAFGDLVKHEVSEITGFRVDHIEEHKEDFRTLLQVWGSDFRRSLCGELYWLKKMRGIIEASRGHYDILFVTDVRFPNEADLIKELGGKMIRVVRRVDVYDTYPNGIDDHASETALDDYPDYDYVLDNDKSRDKLKDAVEKMLHTLNLHGESA